ncbi:MAG: sensor histidine kinase [Salibacteraceae bacterium]
MLPSPLLRDMLRHAPFLLLLQLIEHITVIVSALLSDEPLLSYYHDPFPFLFSFEILFIPLMAINAIYWAQQWLTHPRDLGWRPILVKSLGTIVGVLMATMLMEEVYALWDIYDDDTLVFGEITLSPYASNLVTNTAVGLAIGIPLFLRQSRRRALQNQLADQQMEMDRLEQMKTKAELLALQARINPHFLYNSLNSIASLIHTKPDHAEQMVMQLADLFRYSLNTQGLVWTTLGEELDIVKTYLSVEQVRFGKQLEVSLDCPDDLRHRKVPRFLLQPLVENALKHGAAKQSKGEISLVIKEEKEKLVMELGDNGPPFPSQLINGYGWQSTYDKLQLLYEDRYEVLLQNEPQKRVRIKIPAHQPELNHAL